MGNVGFFKPIENKDACRVQWQKKDEEEDCATYADRVRILQGFGAVNGLRSLAVESHWCSDWQAASCFSPCWCWIRC